MGTFVGFALTYFPFLIPVKKLYQTKKLISFRHPSPAYPEHILIIPRRIARTVFDLSPDDFTAVIEAAVTLSREHRRDYSLLINGGGRQDVMQAHFHLFTGYDIPETRRGQALNDLNDFISRKTVTEKGFSLLFQFNNNSEPLIYLI
jgi:diadenosine tetraphosphate (Ap4A) HIT family hydrolase